jgi:hypothetical protein
MEHLGKEGLEERLKPRGLDLEFQAPGKILLLGPRKKEYSRNGSISSIFLFQYIMRALSSKKKQS